VVDATLHRSDIHPQQESTVPRRPSPFTGVGVALLTLFDEAGELDAAATAAHAARLVELGMRAVVVAGTTGEAAALDAGERRALVAAVRGAVPPEVPVIAGTGAPSARQAATLTRDAVEAGADAVLALSPARVHDHRQYFAAVRSAAGDLPVLAYHFPAVSPPGIAAADLAALDIDGVKDSTGDAARLLETLASFDGATYVGAAPLLALAGPVGATGAILALGNLAPEGCAQAFAGDAAAQRGLLEGHRAASRDFPHGLKRAVADRFATSTAARLG